MRIGRGQNSVRRLAAITAVVAFGLIPACSRATIGQGKPELIAAVNARLTAESRGFASGNPTTAASLSADDAAIGDQNDAKAIGAQIASGDTTDYGFDVLNVDAYPLDGGASDFIAYETIRAHASGGISRAVEVYHRDAPNSPWKSAVQAYFNDNIELPHLSFDHGNAHRLTTSQMQSQSAQPEAIAARYATAMDDARVAGRLAAGTFAPSAATTGVAETETNFISQFSSNGTSSVQWTANPEGEAVALSNGVLVFASVEETKALQGKVEGRLRYFTTQDTKRLAFGGLLAPGNYIQVSQMLLVDIVVIVAPQGPPDVVAVGSATTSIIGTRA